MGLTLHSSPPAVALCGNAMKFDFSTAEYAQDFVGMHFKVKVYNDDTSVYDEISIEKRVTPDSAHHCEIDVSKLLKWNPEKVFTYPGTTSDLLTKRNDLRKKYYITYSQKYGIPLAEYNADDTDPPQYVLSGGLSRLVQARYNANASNWWADKLTESPKTFLSKSAASKNTDALASERLYFIFPEAKAEIYLQVKVYYEDYPNGITTERKKIVNAAIYDIYEIDCSFSSLGLGATDDSGFGRVLKYDVWLTDGAADYSEVKTFVVDEVYNQNVRHFMFNNYFGVPEGIRFTGLLMGKSEFNSALADFILDADAIPSDSARNYLEASERRSFLMNSGWISLAEMNFFREFLTSRRRYWLVNSMALPVTIKDLDVITSEDDEHLYQVEVEFSLGFEDESPADDLTVEELEAENYGTGSELTSLGPHDYLGNRITGWTNIDFVAFDSTGETINTATAGTAGQKAKTNTLGLELGDTLRFDYLINPIEAGLRPKVYLWNFTSGEAASPQYQLILEEEAQSITIVADQAKLTGDVRLVVESTSNADFGLGVFLQLKKSTRFINESYENYVTTGETVQFVATDATNKARTSELTTVLPGDILVFLYTLTLTSGQKPKIAMYDDDYSVNAISEEKELSAGTGYVLLRVDYIVDIFALVDCYARLINTAASDFTLTDCSLKKVNTELLKQLFNENNY